MFVKSLSLKNFKNVSSINIDDLDKINLIVGQNGQGKSAIISALTLLFCNHIEGKMSDYIKWGEKSFFLNTVFEHRGNLYDYAISCTKKSTTRSLSINGGEPINNSEATKYMEEHVVDPDLAMYSSVSLQQQAINILFDNPAPRLQRLKQLFKIDKLDAIAEKIKADAKELQGKIDALKVKNSVYEGMVFELKEVPVIDFDLEAEEKLLQSLQTDKEQFESRSKQYEQYLALKKKYDSDQSDLAKLNAQLKDVEKELESCKEISLTRDYESEMNTLYKLMLNIRVKIQDVDNLDEHIKKKEKEIKDLGDPGEEPVSKYGDLFTERLIGEIAETESKYISLKAKVALAKEGKCSKCGAEIKEDPESIDRMIKEAGELEALYKEKHELLVTAKEERKSFVDLLSSYQKKKAKYTELEKDHASSITLRKGLDLEAFTKEVSDLESKHSELKKMHTKSIVAKGWLQNHDLLVSSIRSLSNTKAPVEVEKPVLDIKAYDLQKSIVLIHRQVVKTYELALAHNEQVTKQKEEATSAIKKNTEEMEAIGKALHVLKDTQTYISRDFAAYLINTSTEYIKAKMNEFFRLVYGGRYVVSFENDGKGIDFFYGRDESEKQSINLLSGFEKALFSISFRYALASLQPEFGLVLLDEVDSDASSDKSIDLFKTLFEQRGINQYFIITHIPETQEFIEHCSNANVYTVDEGALA